MSAATMKKFEKSCYTAMLLVLVMLLAETQVRGDCEKYVDLPSETSAHHFGVYGNTTEWNSCKWILSSPWSTRMEASCSPIYELKGKSCSDQKISMSRTGDSAMTDATHSCNNSMYEFSVENKMAISLGMSPIEGGFLFCHVLVMKKVEACDCGNRNTARIIGGVETGINEFPMMAAIVRYSTRVLICGATIISERYALTAAHCVGKGPPQDLGLHVGDHDHNETDSNLVIPIDRVIVHPEYKAELEDVENDIALVHTDFYIRLSRKLGTVCLPFGHRDELFANEKVTALGWGQTEIYGQQHQFSNVLRKADFTVQDDTGCSSPINLCMFKEGHGICNRDPGGPVLWYDSYYSKLLLVGVQRSGGGCGELSNINTRVTVYLDWIEKNTPDAQLCKNY